MSKDPAFLFYTADFVVGTMLMTDDQVGKYIRLLCMQHQYGHLDKDTVKLISKNDRMVLSKFETDDEGLLFNKRLETEIKKREKYIRTQTENGKLGGRPTKPKQNLQVSSGLTQAKPKQNPRVSFGLTQTKAKQNPGENENINININTNIDTNIDTDISSDIIANSDISIENEASLIDLRFEAFWSAYPKKKAKQDAYRRFCKIAPSDEFLVKILEALERQKKSEEWKKDNGQFIPYPATWLNRGQWEDEVEPKAQVKYSSHTPEEAIIQAMKRDGDEDKSISPAETMLANALRHTYNGEG